MLTIFTTVVTGYPSLAEVQLNVLAQPNSMLLFVYVTASRRITTIHSFSRMSTRMGHPTTQWSGQNFVMAMDWTPMGIRTVELSPDMMKRASSTIVLVTV